MIKILVTGATGFIGRHLVLELKNAGYDVFEVNSTFGDIANEKTWLTLPPCEVVIHLAAATFVPSSWENSSEFLKTNLLGTVCALEYCNKYRARLVFLSSYLYGRPDLLPITEDALLHPNNPYALSKKLAEDVCEFYSNFHGIKIIILRPFNVYGPGQSDNFLIPSIIKQAISGNEIQVKDLEPKRDYVFINDLVDAISKAMIITNNNFHIFNIGTGISYSVAELIDTIQNVLKTNLKVNSSNERRPEEIMDTKADITKAQNILGWTPKWSLMRGIEMISESMKRDFTK